MPLKAQVVNNDKASAPKQPVSITQHDVSSSATLGGFRPRVFAPNDMLHLQRTLGNRAIQLMVGQERLSHPQPATTRAASPALQTIQRSFKINEEAKTAIDQDTTTEYLITGTYKNGDTEAWILVTMHNNVEIYVDKKTLEKIAKPASSGATKSEETKKRKTTEYNPEFSDSSDDEHVSFSPSGKMRAFIDQHAKKRKRDESPEEKSLPTINETLALDTQMAREQFVQLRNSTTSDQIPHHSDQTFQVGQQTLRIGMAAGHFIQAGGNAKKRPKGVKEPHAEYAKLFPQIKSLGKDANAVPLYNSATGESVTDLDASLTDQQAAAIALYYMNGNASTIEQGLKKRTQLTECLSKLTTITGVAEVSRAMEATYQQNDKSADTPYDAMHLIKGSLEQVRQGKKTLQDIFFEGTGGRDSVFIGAPNEEIAGVGGAAQLRDPFGHPTALGKQMEIFPDSKKNFKGYINNLASSANTALPPLTKEQKQELITKEKQSQEAAADRLLQEIQDMEVPSNINHVLGFLTDKKGSTIPVYQRKLNGLKKDLSGNNKALEKLNTAQQALTAKKKAAEAVR